jgi:hypothetical protein
MVHTLVFLPAETIYRGTLQALFRCQCTLCLFYQRSEHMHRFSLPAGSSPDIPMSEARGLTARYDKGG